MCWRRPAGERAATLVNPTLFGCLATHGAPPAGIERPRRTIALSGRRVMRRSSTPGGCLGEKRAILGTLCGRHTCDGPSDRSRVVLDLTLIPRADRGRLEPFDDEVDPERELPHELRDGGDGCRQGDLREDLEQDADKRNDEQGTTDEPQHRHTP